MIARNECLHSLAVLSEVSRHLEVAKYSLDYGPQLVRQLLEVLVEDLVELVAVYLLLLVLDRLKEELELGRILFSL